MHLVQSRILKTLLFYWARCLYARSLHGFVVLTKKTSSSKNIPIEFVTPLEFRLTNFIRLQKQMTIQKMQIF